MMALPSSSSPSTSERKYLVFLSFRGEDTRKNFTSHLDAALRRNKIRHFIDNELHKGDEISESLLKAIEESEIAIIIFSKGYATSRWCLEELAKILECKKLLNLIVIPVFYQVDPSVVRNQTGTFGEAFVKHEERFKQSLEKVQRWRAALTEAASLSGFDSNVIRSEADLINEIIEVILKRLNHMSPRCYNKDLVGVGPSSKEIELLLSLESKDVRIIGFWGMGGIGKTTLAHAVYNKISSQFESHHFVNDVREKSEKHELTRLGRELLSAILEDDKFACLESIFTKSRLRNKKILIVFDDVTRKDQIEKLVGDLEYCYGLGSRIIITSRDKQALKNCGVSSHNIYEVKELLDDPALQLFSRHAFKLNQPIVDYMEVSQKIVRFAKGVPLALKVLGGLLLDKTIEEWQSAVSKLERNPDSQILNVLRISYDGLEESQKNIFLDIACFLKGSNKNFVMDYFEAIESGSEFQVGVLRDKSLISERDDIITMHDLLQEMGKNIVKEESKYPGKRSRLWCHKDVIRVLRTNAGTETIEGIDWNMSNSEIKNITLEPNAFLKMPNLRYFNFHDNWNGIEMHAPQGLKFNYIELRYFGWFGYPLKALPSNFDPTNLVSLCLRGSNLKQIFNEGQRLDKLKYVDLSYSEQLIRIPALSVVPNLESLILIHCTNLIEVPSSIRYLEKLVYLNLCGCESLSSLPTSFPSKPPTRVILSGCSNLKTVPKITCNMKELTLRGTSITHFSLAKCRRVESLPSTIWQLEYLALDNCRITKLPDCLSQLCNIGALHLSGNNFVCIPSLSKLSSLGLLTVNNCKRLQSLPELPSTTLLCVDASNCTSLEVISNSLFSKTQINLGYCFKLDQDMLKAELEKAIREGGDEQRQILLPGNEIPEWFSVQNMGSSITLKIPPDYTSQQCIYVDMCLVVTLQDDNEGGYNCFRGYAQCIGQDKDGKTEQLEGMDFRLDCDVPEGSYHTSDHVFFKYNISCSTRVLDKVPEDRYLTSDHVASKDDIDYSIMEFNRQEGQIVYFDVRGGFLTFDFCSDRERNEYEVKKCGIKLLPCQDTRFNYDEEDEEEKEEEQQAKRQKL